MEAGILCVHTLAMFSSTSWISPLPVFCFWLRSQGQEQEEASRQTCGASLKDVRRFREQSKEDEQCQHGAQRKDSQAEASLGMVVKGRLGAEPGWCAVFGVGTQGGGAVPLWGGWSMAPRVGRGAHTWHWQWPGACVCPCLIPSRCLPLRDTVPSRLSLLHF